MADKLFYIKSDRKTTGPFPLEQLEKMYANGLLKHSDMVSENKVSWQSAEKFFAEPEKVEPQKTPSIAKTLTLNVAKVFFPDFKVPQEEEKKAKVPAKKSEAVVVPEPVCSVISLVWNAPAALKNLQLMREFKQKRGEVDNTSVYVAVSGGLLILLLFLLLFAAVALYLPAELAAVGLAAIFAVGAFVVFLLENLCLSAIFNVEKLLDCDFLTMQMLTAFFAAFCFALPISALISVGTGNIPAALKVLIIFFSCTAAAGETVNMIWGFTEVNRRIFKMNTAGLITVSFLQVVQLILAGFAVWKFFKII